MIFVVDTNIVFSGLLRNSTVRELLMMAPFELIAPETILLEIRKHEQQIIERSNLNKEEFEILFSLLTENIQIIRKEMYEEKISEAKELIEKEEAGDVPFLALALSVTNDGIWTQDKHFQAQKKVKIWNTIEMIEKFRETVDDER